jgi:hypothetical protein
VGTGVRVVVAVDCMRVGVAVDVFVSVGSTPGSMDSPPPAYEACFDEFVLIGVFVSASPIGLQLVTSNIVIHSSITNLNKNAVRISHPFQKTTSLVDLEFHC